MKNKQIPLDEVPQIRILDYGHYSTSDITRDSNYFVHKCIFKYINKYYPDKFFFNYTYEQSEKNDIIIKKLTSEYRNIKAIPLRYWTSNAFFRNSLDYENINKDNLIYDIIWNNVPEISFELLSYAISKGIYCPIMSYSHWLPSLVSAPIIANYDKKQMEQNCMFVKYFYNYFICHCNYNNSKWGTKLINDSFSVLPSQDFNNKIKDKIKPLYLTVDHEEVNMFKPEIIEKNQVPVIVFNNRHNSYTGFTFFIQTIKEVIKIRPQLKFKIFMTAVGDINKAEESGVPSDYFLSKTHLPYPEYIKQLWNSDIQLGTHDGTNQWSLSFLDGMFCNLIPFYKRGHFFDEMFEGLDLPSNYNFKNENEFIERLIFMLENIDYFRERNKPIYNHFKNNWTWDLLIHDWARAWIDTYNQNRIYDTEKLNLINLDDLPISWSKFKGVLNISAQRPLNTYRKSFKELREVKEDMTQAEPVFYRKDQSIRKTEGFF